MSQNRLKRTLFGLLRGCRLRLWGREKNRVKRIWFVTGTSGGVGRELVDEILKAGQSVVATTRNAKALQEKLNKEYDAETLKRLLVVELDVTKVDSVKTAFAKAIDRFGRIDAVVNNAAYSVIGELEAVPIDVARAQFDVLYWGVYNVCKEAIRIFREVNPKGDGGHIFNISSFIGYTSLPSVGTYCAAKFAVEGFSESLAKELDKEWNIRITIIQPGGIATGWRNMEAVPMLPAYDTDSSPAKGTRNMFLGVDSEGKPNMPFIGDPFKVAKAFITLADLKKDLPLRIQLGSDALAVVRFKAAQTISDSEKSESISHSTNTDGMDGEGYGKVMVSSWS